MNTFISSIYQSIYILHDIATNKIEKHYYFMNFTWVYTSEWKLERTKNPWLQIWHEHYPQKKCSGHWFLFTIATYCNRSNITKNYKRICSINNSVSDGNIQTQPENCKLLWNLLQNVFRSLIYAIWFMFYSKFISDKSNMDTKER